MISPTKFYGRIIFSSGELMWIVANLVKKFISNLNRRTIFNILSKLGYILIKGTVVNQTNV